MPFLTVLAGLLLILIGIAFKVGTGTESWTPLIPAIPGLLILLCGIAAMKPTLRMHMVHAALALALLTVLAVTYRIFSTIEAAVAAQVLSTLVCVAFLAAGIKSFLDARAKRKEANSEMASSE